MEDLEVLEDLSSWEVIPSLYVQQRTLSSTQSGEEDLGAFIKEDFYDESAAFPPSEHEGLEVEVSNEGSFEASPSSPSYSEPEDGDLQDTPQSDSLLDSTVWMGKQMRLGICNLSRRIVAAATFFWPCAACRAKVWTLNSITAFVAAVVFTLAYARMKQLHKKALEESKHRIIILLRRKEQKISLLLLQIARMNEMFLARRTVPVLRTY